MQDERTPKDPQTENAPTDRQGEKTPKVGGAYAHYVVCLSIVTSSLSTQHSVNFVPRHSRIWRYRCADGLSTAQCSQSYAVFGIPLARFADVWVRRSLISLGLVFWSAMTAIAYSVVPVLAATDWCIGEPVLRQQLTRCFLTII